MLVTYFDEVKYQPGKQRYYWLGGICATPEAIWRLETAVAALSKEVFGKGTLCRETEFHAAEIFHRKRNFKHWPDINARIDVLKRLFKIIDSEQELAKIYVRIEPARMIRTDHEITAFMFFIERTELHLRAQKAPGILIGDRESDVVSGLFAETLSQYRHTGTKYEFGVDLTHLIDTVHFTDSHHSRMLQLADLYVWAVQFYVEGANDAFPRSEIARFIREETRLLAPNRYKEWPTDQSRLRVGG